LKALPRAKLLLTCSFNHGSFCGRDSSREVTQKTISLGNG
jgi:hypothetical protein